MAITLKGDGTIEGLAVGGLPNSTVKEEDLAFTIDTSGSDTNTVTGGRVRQAVQTLNNTQTVNQDVGSFDMRRATIPQITEGIEVLSATITPTAADSILLIQSLVHLGPALDGHRYAIMLFQDDTTDALEMATTLAQSGGDMQDLSMQFRKIAGTTSPITFSVRVAPQSGQGVFINRGNVSNIGGGSLNSSLVVWEITEGIDALNDDNGGNTNPPSSGPQDAFLVGGSAGGITNPDIINYAFASDSQSVHGLSFNGTLGGGGIDGGTANSSTTDGYYSTGGSTPFRTDITRFSFASTGNAVSIGNTDRHRSAARIGTNSPTDGYIHGGRGLNVVGQLSSCIKFQFAESSTSSSAVFNLDTTKSNIGCHSTTTRGYLYGGANDPGVIGSCIEFVFANDQTRIDIQNLNESSGSHVALGNNTNAYICGGTAGGGVNFTRIDTHLLSSSASLTSHGDLNTAVNSHNGASTNISGITLCGTANGSNTSKKQTFSYASNVVATDLPAFTLAFEGPGACQVPVSF
jgi:hypothetical protein